MSYTAADVHNAKAGSGKLASPSSPSLVSYPHLVEGVV